MGGYGRRLSVLAVALGACVASAQERHAAARSGSDVRASVAAIEAQLARAVDRVSLPHAARLVGRGDLARGYRIPGYGVVLVLTPRALPGPTGRVYHLRHGARPRVLGVAPTFGGQGAAVGLAPPEAPEEVESFERQVIVLQAETEAARREAEQEMERIVHEVRVRVAPPAPPGSLAPNAPPDPPAAPAAPRAEPPAAPEEPPPPPWKFWFEMEGPREARSPDAVIAAVRRTVIDALASRVPAPLGLPGEERVAVAVDFVPGGLLAPDAPPNRTLVVSVRAKDVAARARGALSAEELARRIEVSEY
jgi:hypothetical protein